MKIQLLSTFLLLIPFAMADEVQMLDGKVYKNCTVAQESDTSISLVVPIKKGIKDIVTLKKDEVKLVIRSTPDEKSFSKLSETYDVQDVLGDRLAWANEGVKAYEGFLSKYPKSKLKPDAEKKLEALRVLVQQEKEKIAKKEAEREAAEPTPEELMRGRYDIEANKLLATMKAKAKQSNAVGAMQSYDSLRKNYTASEAYLEGTDLVSKFLPQLNANLDKMIAAAKVKNEADEKRLVEERKAERKLLSKMTDEQKESVKKREEERRNIQKAKREQYRNFQEKLRDKKMRWFNPDPGYIDSLEDLKRVAEQDLRDIKQELEDRKSEQSESGKATAAFKKAWELVDAGKFEEARDALSTIRSCRVNQEYWSELQTKIMDGVAAAKEAERTKRQQEYAKRMAERKKNQEIRRKKYSLKDLKDSNKSDNQEAGKGKEKSKASDSKK